MICYHFLKLEKKKKNKVSPARERVKDVKAKCMALLLGKNLQDIALLIPGQHKY